MARNLGITLVQRSIPRRLAALVAVFACIAGTALAAAAPGASGSANCTVQYGQSLIDEGRYDQAIRVFTCVIAAAPAEADGYRGRAEARLFLGRYSDAFRDYTRITANVIPVQPDAMTTIHSDYAARLAVTPDSIAALRGASFARWVDFQYQHAIHLLDDLLELRPNDAYGNLFRGSSRVLKGVTTSLGVADLDYAITLDPASPDVRSIVADAYTYGLVDRERAFAEASLALDWGLDTPRVHAILAASYNAFGDLDAAAVHTKEHIDQVTTELVTAPTLAVGGSLTLDLVAGRTYEIPIPAIAGQPIRIETSSKDYWDSIAVLLKPDGTPVVGSDDDSGYFAAFEHVAQTTGTYRLQATYFESVNAGQLIVTRN